MNLGTILIKGYSEKEYNFLVYPKTDSVNIDKGCVYILADLLEAKEDGANLYSGRLCKQSPNLKDERLDNIGNHILVLFEDSKIERDYIARDINLYYNFE